MIARDIAMAAGFVPDGETATECFRIGTARSPVYGGIGGELRTAGGRERLRLPNTNIRLTLGPRTVYLYRLDGTKPVGIGSWRTAEFTADALAAALVR